MNEQRMKSLDRLVGALNELNDLDCGKVLGIGLARRHQKPAWHPLAVHCFCWDR